MIDKEFAMPWWGWVLLVLALLYAIGTNAKPGSGREGKSGKGPRAGKRGQGARKEGVTAQGLAERVTSPSELRALERRRQAAEDAAASAGDEAEYERAVARSELLEEAIELAIGKVLRWQYLPQVDLDTPSSTIRMAFKVFDAQRMKELRRTVGGGEGDWHGLDGYADREDEPEYLKGLLRYRAIVESSVGVEEKASKIQSLLREESALASEFFEEEGEGWTYADQYLIGELRSVGVPKVDQFYSRGFRTAEAIAALDTSVVRGWKGVGPKTAQAFEEWKQGRKRSG